MVGARIPEKWRILSEISCFSPSDHHHRTSGGSRCSLLIVITHRPYIPAMLFAFFLLLCAESNGQSKPDQDEPDLTGFSSEQLVACFDEYELCGAADSRATGWQISDELAKRGDPHELLVRYWRERKWLIRDGIEHVAYHFDTPEVIAFMKKVVAQRVKDGEDRYFPVNYLAKKCDEAALKELATGRYRNQGSLQYETSVELFGKCSYRPAIPYLVDTAVYDWSFNIVIAADHSLHALYPDGPKDFDRLEKMQKYFCGRARAEDFKVRCKAE